MCLFTNAVSTGQMKKSKLKTFKAYKVFNFEVDSKGKIKLIAPYLKTKFTVLTDGTIKSNRKRGNEVTKYELSNGVNKGIHVYRELGSAKYLASGHLDRIVAEVTCEKADFVGCNQAKNHCVFSKIKLNKAKLAKDIKDKVNINAPSRELELSSLTSTVNNYKATIINYLASIEKAVNKFAEKDKSGVFDKAQSVTF